MIYLLQAENEGHSMNISKEFKGTKKEACQHAQALAVGLKLLFPKCDPTCRVISSRTIRTIVAWSDGQFIDGGTGNFIKI